MVSSADQRPRPLPSITSLQKLLLCLSASLQLAHAGPYPKDDLHDVLGAGFLVDRSCATYCGVDNQYCCAQGQACTTNAGIAGCTDTALGGGFGIYTTTWTETDTYTSTISSYYPATTGDNGADCVPPAGSGQIACGPICCASWQYCASNGQCGGGPGPGAGATTTEAAGGGGGGMITSTITTSGTTITTQYSAPYRVTSGTTGTGTTTSTGTLESATATGSGNGTAVTTGGNGLSGGAIAGIVIGVIAGVVLLLAICACCIMRGLWHGLLAIFGLGPGRKRKSRSRDRETIIVEEERYRRGGSAAAHSRRDTHTGWFAARPPPRSAAGSRRASGVSEKKRESTNAGWWGAGALGTLGLLLGLRRDKKRKEQAKRTSRARSDVSSSYFSDSYTASSPSEFSSDYTYSSVYTRPPQSHAPVQAHRGPPTVYSASGAGRERDDYFKSNVPPDYAGSASSGGRTRDTRRSRRTETTRISRAPSRR
ncbi:hypothetical protein INS49_010438 [Diaporthe citri]|uniref:uncharacterized protein n=1 Tax=Diaporthe citri TaxID=83186 RepID=UPI001C8164AE|nr:uncharacterized protein INS49_010438 [Diaporthe citri]KAG6362208.1 hypothetical protein INS49_010438 [Diaporthe citri]